MMALNQADLDRLSHLIDRHSLCTVYNPHQAGLAVMQYVLVRESSKFVKAHQDG